MPRVWSIREATAVVAEDDGRQLFVIKAVDSVQLAGKMVRVFAGKPPHRVERIGAVRHVKKVAIIFDNVLRTARRIARRRRLYRKNATSLFKAYDKLSALALPQDATCKLQYLPRRRFGAPVLRFLRSMKKKSKKKSMRRVVQALGQRVHSVAIKVQKSDFLTSRLSKILKSLIHDVEALLRRRVILRRPRLPAT